MISVMIPTRGRPDLLASSIFSLHGRATVRSRIEVLIAVDNDDDETLSIAGDLEAAHLVQHVEVFNERHGYAGLNEYFNALAKAARGTWVYLWNDDAVMLTDGWDDLVMDQQPHYVLQTIRRTRFPLIPKVWVDHLGHLSLDRHCDTWWDEISRRLVRSIGLPIEGAHAVPNDLTAAERQYDVDGLLAKKDLIEADVERIRELL